MAVYNATMNSVRLMVVLTCTSLAGCAGLGGAVTAEYAVEHPKEYVEPVVSAGEGVVFFYGIEEFAPGSLIYSNNVEVGVVHPGQFSYLVIDAGTHTFTSRMNGQSSVTFDISAGSEYFVKYWVETGFWGPRPNLELVPVETGRASALGMRYSVHKPHDPPLTLD